MAEAIPTDLFDDTDELIELASTEATEFEGGEGTALPNADAVIPVLGSLTTETVAEDLDEPSTNGKSRKRNVTAERDPEDLIPRYLEEIGRYPLLTKDDEARLSQAVQAGLAASKTLETNKRLIPIKKHELRKSIQEGETAHHTFTTANLRLVVSIAKYYQSTGVPLLDLIQEGSFGLMHAVNKFDWRKGFKFSTYATKWIHQAITNGIPDNKRNIRLPVQKEAEVRRMNGARAELAQELRRTPTVGELATKMGMPLADVLTLLWFEQDTLSLETPLSDESNSDEVGDLVADPNSTNVIEAATKATDYPEALHKLLKFLSEHEQKIIKLRFGLDDGEFRTHEEVSRHFKSPRKKDQKLTRESVRRQEAVALAKMSHPSTGIKPSDLF